MKRTENIQGFVMGTAHYLVSGKEGDEAVLRVDYRNNTYTLQSQHQPLSRIFQREVAEIAQDLLKRKHGVNFAKQGK